MRPRVAAALLLLLLVFLLLALAEPGVASVLGLRPQPAAPPQRFLGEDPGILLDRASSLEARLPAMQGEELFQGRLEVIELYAATTMPKHRATALELCDELRRRNPDRMEPLLLEAQIQGSMEQLSAAIRLLHEEQERFSSRPEFMYALGYYYFELGLPLADEGKLRSSRRYFLRAARLNRESRKNRLALAAAALMVRDAQGVLVATSVDGTGEAAVLPALLMRACALHFDGKDEAAHYTFLSAFARMLPDWRATFETGAEFLDPDGDDPEQVRLFWIGVDPHPTQISNSRQVEYWVRLTEADMLFGSFEDWVPGWTTQPGAAWARWGPPSALIFEPADPTPTESPGRPGPAKRGTIPPVSTLPRDLRAPRPSASDMDPNRHHWRWFYGFGEQSFLLTFIDQGLGFHWQLTNESLMVEELVVEKSPLLFAETGRPPSFSLDVNAAGFRAGGDLTRLEIAMGIIPSPEIEDGGLTRVLNDSTPPYRLDWAIFDSQGKRIDHKSLGLGAEKLRSTVLLRVDPGSAALEEEEDPLLSMVALLLPPDRYHLALEAHHPASREHQSVQLVLDLTRPREDVLAISDLQITDTYLPWDGEVVVPTEFVKYAQILIPRPSRTFPEGHRETFVYYEVMGLQRDASGNAHFDVVYELDPLEVDLDSDEEERRRVQMQRQEFLAEVTGISEGGKVIKGTRVDLSQLTVGPWLLRVIVEDLVAGSEVFRELEIQIGE